LTLLNAEPSLEWAQAFAGRVSQKAGADRSAQVVEAVRLAFSREPDSWEKDRMLTFLSQQRNRIAEGETRESLSRSRRLAPMVWIRWMGLRSLIFV